jgi:uncharacterized membrane protein
MTKFMQALVIVILVALAAQLVIAAVAPVVPYAIVIGILLLIGWRWISKARKF